MQYFMQISAVLILIVAVIGLFYCNIHLAILTYRERKARKMVKDYFNKLHQDISNVERDKS